MFLRRFYDTKLAQASYMVGCTATGEAIIVDPNRDVDQYIRAATEENVRVTHVTETHIHADFVSGSRELASRTGATLLLSDEGDSNWKYAFAEDAGATLLKDGAEFMVGNLRFEVAHTPGHTPEHLTFFVTDTPATSHRVAAITGDFVFAGDVGRPDLLERAANIKGTMEGSARTLFQSLQRFKQLPDYVQIWPGHGAGSACGKALGAMPFTTVGYERLANWAFAVTDEDEFIRMVLAGQPEPPRYFAEMKRINKEGPAMLGANPLPPLLTAAALDDLLRNGALIVDTRSSDAYATKNIPGTINIALARSFTTWAGWLVPYTKPFYLIVDGSDSTLLAEAVRDLKMIGLDQIAGYFTGDVIVTWESLGNDVGTVTRVTTPELDRLMKAGSVTVLDVRNRAEWEEGRIPGVVNIPLGVLAERLSEVRRDQPVVVHCQGGTRSAMAASVLQSRGISSVLDFSSGFAGWKSAGYPVERGAAFGLDSPV